jgi:hypothetical protein
MTDCFEGKLQVFNSEGQSQKFQLVFTVAVMINLYFYLKIY